MNKETHANGRQPFMQSASDDLLQAKLATVDFYVDCKVTSYLLQMLKRLRCIA